MVLAHVLRLQVLDDYCLRLDMPSDVGRELVCGIYPDIGNPVVYAS